MMETNRRCQPAKPFLGVHFVLFGFDSFSEPKIRFKLMDGGGVEAGQYSPSCTHVIVDKIVYDDPICVAAQKDRKALVTALWVDHSYDNGKAVEFSSIMYRPPKDLNGIPGAKGLVICLTGYQRLDRDDIMTLVGLMGAQFSKPLVANKVTHLICYKFEGEKYDLGKRLPQIKLVNHRWLEDCLREWEILPEDNYNISSYELEMMDAQAKDSEDEVEEVNPKLCVEKSPLKPDAFGLCNSPKLRAETPKAKYSANAGNSIINVGQKSGQTSGFANSVSPKVAALNGLAQNHYQSPLQKHAMNDLIPGSHLHGKFKEALFISPDREKEPGCSYYISSALKEKDALCLERETTYSPGNRAWTGSYGTPYAHKKESGMKPPSFRSSPSLSDQIPVVKTTLIDNLHEKSKSRDAAGCGNSPTEGDSSARQSSCFTKKPQPELLSSSTVSESPSKRLKASSASRVSGMSNVEIGKLPHTGNQKNDSSSLSLAGIGDAVTKTYKKNMGAKKALGSRLLSASKSKPQENWATVTDRDGAKEVETLDDETETPDEEAELAMKYIVGEESNGAFDLAREFDFSNEKEPETEGLSNAVSAGTSETAVKQPRNSLKRKKAQQKESSPIESKHSVEVRERLDKIDEVKESEKEKKAATSPAAKSKNRRLSKRSHEEEKENDEVQASEKEEKTDLDPVSARSNNKKAAKSKPKECHEEEKEKNEIEVSEKETKVELGPASAKLKKKKLSKNKSDKSHGKEKEQNEVEMLEKEKKADSAHVSAEPKVPKPSKSKSKNSREEEKDNNEVEVSEKETKEESVTAFAKSKKPKPSRKKLKKSREKDKEKDEIEVSQKETKADSDPAKSKNPKQSKTKSKKSEDEEKEKKPVDTAGNENRKRPHGKQDFKSDALPVNDEQRSGGSVVDLQRTEPAFFIVSGHRFQRKEFQKVIRSLKGRVCRDSHQWSYQATHFIAPDPIKRTEKFFAAAASGRWILKTDYLSACKNAGKLLPEEPYEWHGNTLSEDGAISLEAPRKWRLLRERTSHGAFHGLNVVIYGECIAPSLDTLKRAVKAGDGTILATSPPYTRFLDSNIDFAIVTPGMPRADMWVQEFLKRNIPCVAADYLVEYVCKTGSSLERHVLFNCHESARLSFERLQARQDEVVFVDTGPLRSDDDDDDMPCDVCGSRNRGEVMLICGDENGSTGCGVGRHIDCCNPPLKSVPDDDWFCSDCAPKGQRSDKSTKKRKLKSK